MTKDKAKEVWEDYCGQDALSIKWFQDPQVPTTYAIRGTYRHPNNPSGLPRITLDLLAICVHRIDEMQLPQYVGMYVEEVEFESWPPGSGKLKFL